MRVAYWFNNLQAQSGLSADEMREAPHLVDLSTIDFGLYAEQRRKPSTVTLKLIEKEYPGTSTFYEVGPDEIPLWAVLEGNVDACMAVIDEELRRAGENLEQRVFFKEKATRLWLSMLPSHLHYWKSLGELLTMPGFNVIASTYAESQGIDTAQSRASGKVYLQTQITAVIALWKLCPRFPESEADALCRYMLEGVLEAAVRDEFPVDIGAPLTRYLGDALGAN